MKKIIDFRFIFNHTLVKFFSVGTTCHVLRDVREYRFMSTRFEPFYPSPTSRLLAVYRSISVLSWARSYIYVSRVFWKLCSISADCTQIAYRHIDQWRCNCNCRERINWPHARIGFIFIFIFIIDKITHIDYLLNNWHYSETEYYRVSSRVIVC